MVKEHEIIVFTQKEAMELLKMPKIFKRALRAGWIKPIIQGGRGRRSIFDAQDVLDLVARLKIEKPPKLPSEVQEGVMRFIGPLLDFILGKREPVYIPPAREEVERAIARKFAEQQAQREAEALEAEAKEKTAKAFENLRSDEPVEIEIDSKLLD